MTNMKSKKDPNRITLILDVDVEASLRKKQAMLIAKTHKSVSFSRMINDMLRDSVKKHR